jgi:fibronectin type 3 domain-containing protein
LPGPSRYNIYREMSPDPFVLPASAAPAEWQVMAPAPLNPAPIAAPHFEDAVAADDRERCYDVRTVRSGVEGPPSARRCVRVIDIFPPATPTNLGTIPADGFITLIWEPNIEDDLGGYVVLRSADGGATLLTLTPTPIAVTQYFDRAVKPGVQYTYEVRAVDSRVPVPNISEPARVIETLR